MNSKILVSYEDKTVAYDIATKLTEMGQYAEVVSAETEAIDKIIETNKPDVVVCPAVMPGGGIVALMNKHANATFVVVGPHNPMIENFIFASSRATYVQTPVDNNTLAFVVNTFAAFGGGQSERELATKITSFMHDIGVAASIKGYHYMREALILSTMDPEYLESVTKLLYPTIAKKFNTTPSRVERAIRHAIENVWDKGNLDKLNEIFGYTYSQKRGKPTNSEFLALIADNLRNGFAM